ncbi:MAG TPA: penicillin-binding protein, partial [Sphingomonas bacterium]|nr:penicillin-binding protein [Sphingomonas bacterium]
MAEADANSVNFRLQRGEGASGWFTRLRRRWWFRLLAVLALLAGIGMVAGWALFARDLPSVDALKAYEPPLPTTIRSADGTPIHTYARERRVELDYAEFPPLLVRAFLAAEDKTFFEHHGVDFPGFAGAVVDYVSKMGTGARARGGSTITQQVAKNLLIGNEYSPSRKVREMILAWRIEDALEKPQILELYLNGIPMGRRAFGVQAAARAYFNKDVDQLALQEMAFLATLPKAPESYGRAANADRALERRNWVLSEMLRNGFINNAQYQTARAQPLGLSDRQLPTLQSNAGYYVEEVRRQLIDRFGEKAAEGPYSVYDGGLWVRTSLDPKIQADATDALRRGLLRFDSGRGWSGPIKMLDIADGWQGPLLASNMAIDFDNWRVGVVVSRGSDSAEIGFTDGTTGTMPRWGAQMPVRGKGGTAFAALKAGDVIAVAPEGGQWVLRSIPRISGGMVVEDPRTGRLLALQGGFDASLDSFNRATQA